MRTSEILSTLAVCGTVATVALFNLSSTAQGSAFIAAPVGEVEVAFQNFLAKYHKSYGTKEEYNFRYTLFATTYHDVMSHIYCS